MTGLSKVEATQANETDSVVFIKFCPICGDKMHTETMYDRLWWVCNDPECGFSEWAD